MTIQAFQKALCRLPLEQEERDSLTADELFLLVLTRRLKRLSWTEQRRMAPGDLHDLTVVGLIGGISAPAQMSR